MIRLTDDLWIGNSLDGEHADLRAAKIGAILNVANDLLTLRYRWDGAEYMKVGIIDGPGNEVIGYCSAILALVTLLRRHDAVMVYDHEGSRAMAVCMMYLNLTEGQYRPDPLQWSHWLTWEERLTRVNEDRRPPKILPEPHAAHREAFAKIPYGLLEALL